MQQASWLTQQGELVAAGGAWLTQQASWLMQQGELVDAAGELVDAAGELATRQAAFLHSSAL
jgi:ubiquinone biosynthesis protein UbiJ